MDQLYFIGGSPRKNVVAERLLTERDVLRTEEPFHGTTPTRFSSPDNSLDWPTGSETPS